MTHGRKPRRPRPTRNPIETAMLRATRLTEAEIAETLDMSLNTVKSHLRRGMSVLRARLQREAVR